MIFTPEHYVKVLNGEKTVTRRTHEPRIKIGNTYAMQPGRGKPAWWLRRRADSFVLCSDPRGYVAEFCMIGTDSITTQQANDWLKRYGAIRCEITITDMYQEPLQAISDDHLQREGGYTRDEYRAVWHDINRYKKGFRWVDNPTITVVEFECPPELVAAWERYQRGQSDGS